MGGHKPVYIAAIVGACVAFVICIIFNALASTGGKQLGIYLNNNTGDISDKYFLEITPAGWTFSIWGVIYSWQVLFLGYGLSTICRRGPSKGFLYYDPGHMPVWMYFIYVINMGLNVGWLLLWDREFIAIALAFIALTPFTLYIMLILTCKGVVDHGPELIASGQRKEIWLTRILVHNGLAIYATWVTIATLLNMAMVIAYWGDIAQETASTIALAVLSFEILLYWILDNFILDRYVRYILTPYLVVIVALVGSIYKNWDPIRRNSIFTAVLLAVGATLTLIKFVLMVWRFIKRPIFTEMQTSNVPQKTKNTAL